MWLSGRWACWPCSLNSQEPGSSRAEGCPSRARDRPPFLRALEAEAGTKQGNLLALIRQILHHFQCCQIRDDKLIFSISSLLPDFALSFAFSCTLTCHPLQPSFTPFLIIFSLGYWISSEISLTGRSHLPSFTNTLNTAEWPSHGSRSPSVSCISVMAWDIKECTSLESRDFYGVLVNSSFEAKSRNFVSVSGHSWLCIINHVWHATVLR